MQQNLGQLFKIESMDESEQPVTAQSPKPQKSQFFQGHGQVKYDVMDDFFVQQYKKKYEKKGYNILNTLKEGDFFGGITKKGAEQTFSDIICCTKVEYVCLCFEDYWSILSMYQLRMCEQKIAYLRSYRFLQIYSDHYLNKRLNMFEEVSFNRNQVLFEENELSNYIYFIYEGEFVMNKNIDFKKYLDNMLNENCQNQKNISIKSSQAQQSSSENQDMEMQESENDKNQNACFAQFKKNVIISYLNPGSYIGLSELLTDSTYTYTVSCFSTHAKVYRLFKENFEKFFKCEANVEIMAEDCLGKEMIYEDILQKHANMMMAEYSQQGISQFEKQMIKTFEISKKKNYNSSNVVIPHQHLKSDTTKMKKEMSIIDQRIEEKLNSQSGKISKKEIQKEKSQNLQYSILNSINNDPYFRRKLLNNLSSLGFKINHENCNIYDQLKVHTNFVTSRTSSLSNLQECLSKTKLENHAQTTQQQQVVLQQIPEVHVSIMSIQDKSNKNSNTNTNLNQQSFRSTQKQSSVPTQSLNELNRKRLSFILGCQDKKISQQKSSVNIQHQTSFEQDNVKVKFENSPSIEDLKCSENNITFRKENQTDPNSPQAQLELSNFNSKTSIILSSNNDHEFLAVTNPFEYTGSQSNSSLVFHNNLKIKSLSPQRTLIVKENVLGIQPSSNQQNKYLLSEANSNQNSILKKDKLFSRKSILQSVLSADNSKQQQYLISPKKDEETISPLVSPFQTFRQKLHNNFCNNKPINFSEQESPIKYSQNANTLSNNNSCQIKCLNIKQQQNSQLNSYQGQNKPLSSSPTDASKGQLKAILNIGNTQQSQNSLAQCSVSFSHHSKRQNSVSNIQFNLQGGNTSNIDYKSYFEQMQQQQSSNYANNNNISHSKSNQKHNIHLRAKSQKSFREKLHILVDKHIQDNLNHRKSYIFSNQNTSINKVFLQVDNPSQNCKTVQAIKTLTNNIPTEPISSVRFEQLPDHNTSQAKKNQEQVSPKKFHITNKKQKSLLCFNFPISSATNEENTNSLANSNLQSPIVHKQAEKMLHKRCSIPLMSPTSTKITQLSTAHSPSFSSFQTVFNKNHSRMASDQSCSYITQNLAKNQYL